MRLNSSKNGWTFAKGSETVSGFRGLDIYLVSSPNCESLVDSRENYYWQEGNE
jgi:hypothetical protein